VKKLLVVAVLLLIISSLSFGQTTGNATVTATVQATLSIIKTNDLALGNVQRGGTATVLSTDPGAAAFTISGTASSQVTTTLSALADLTSNGHNMPFTLQTPIYNTSNTQTGASAFGAAPYIASTNVDGNLWVWFGGSVTASAGQAAGTYSGTITVSVTQP